jgi:hypothetical protein
VLPQGPYQNFHTFRKKWQVFLWVDKEDKAQGKCLTSWKMNCKPKDRGGLGVLDLKIQNKALLMHEEPAQIL